MPTRFLVRSLLPLFVFALAGCQDAPEPMAPEPANARLSASSQTAMDRYIVVFEDGTENVPTLARQLASAHGGSLLFVYEHALQGFAAELPEGAITWLRQHPSVTSVEQDQVVHAFGTNPEVPTGVARIFADDNQEIDIDGTDDYRVDVDAAIIDTGIDDAHPDLNVVAKTDCTGGGPFNSSCKDASGDDGNGHGTHVAGTVAALDNGSGVVGVAPGARLHAVKVLRNDGSGYMSWIVAGVDWVTERADRIEVANMSLGCACSSDALDTAISNSVAAGVVYAVAAGNSDADATDYSPANHPDVITVSALADFDGEPGALGSSTCRDDEDDTLANFSNWGDLIEIAAPGVCITSTLPGNDYGTYSGTSMASPHVAGAAALLASGTNDPTSKQEVDAIISTIVDKGNSDWTDDSGDAIQEPLLDVHDKTVFDPALVAGGGDGSTTDDPPSTSITNPTSGATVSGTVDVTADATDDSSVSQVEFFVDGGSIGVDSDDSDGWSYSWDTTGYADGDHTLTATATDDAGQAASDQISVTVDNSSSDSAISLGASGTKVKGVWDVTLEWSGASTDSVDIYRDGGKIDTVVNNPDTTNTYSDQVKGGGSHTYQVCEAGTQTCSNEATVQ